MNTTEKLPLAHAMEEQLVPALNAHLATLKLTELKALARVYRANTRGCAIRAQWEDAIRQVLRREIWDEIAVRAGEPRRGMRFIIK